VGGQRISRSEFQRYLDYTVRFYAWLGRSQARLGCQNNKPNRACTRLRSEILGRLIEEHVVVAYARRHDIVLQPSDQAAVDREATAETAGSGGAPLSSNLGVSGSFLRAVLARELLVRRVEETVAPATAKSGPSFHLRKIIIPIASRGQRAVAYRQAIELATYGRPVPVGADVRVEWVARFRLPADLRSALAVARPGQYTGPFPAASRAYSAYLVVQLLGSGPHAYGKPARQALEARYFRFWIHRQVQQAGPKCFTASSTPTPCPV
jgi:hypothetical protein